MVLKELLCIFLTVHVSFSRKIYFENRLKEEIIVYKNEHDFFYIAKGGDSFGYTEMPEGNYTIYAKYASCIHSDCDKYVTKVQFAIGHIASNLDLVYFDLRSGYNFPVQVRSDSEFCKNLFLSCHNILTESPEDAMVVVDTKLVACKNQIEFLKCDGKPNTLISDYQLERYIKKCLDVDEYTIRFGKNIFE